MRMIPIMFCSWCLLCGMWVQSAYGNKFFHQATINEITQQSIIIDDREHRLHSTVRFYSANNKEIGRGDL